MWVFTKKYGRVSKLLEKRNKIRYCKVALHIISYYTIKFDIILIAYYIDANTRQGQCALAFGSFRGFSVVSPLGGGAKKMAN